MRYEFYYWPMSPGRGEFVRLALEEGGADYVDVARLPESEGGGVPAMLRLLSGETVKTPSFAPPFLKAGDLLIGQTANILLFLGPRHGLAPADEAGRLWTHQLQLTFTDFIKEIHDTHHPIASALYYEEQKRGGQALHRGVPQGARAEISRLFRARAGEERRQASLGQFADLCRPFAVSGRLRTALRLSESDGAAGAGSPAHRVGA